MTDNSEPIPVNEPWEGYSDSTPEGGPAWNRSPGKTAADVNLDAAPSGFKVTGDAAWDSDSDDFAMFTAEGNARVAAMVTTARLKCRTQSEAEMLAWMLAEKEQMAADTAERPYKRGGQRSRAMWRSGTRWSGRRSPTRWTRYGCRRTGTGSGRADGTAMLPV